MSTDVELVAIATELYGGPLADFTTARNARAAETADAALAAGIRSLRKPSVAAWVVNVFAQERADQLGEAIALAEELREAQADLDAKALAQLGRDRRALTTRLASAAADLASSRGERVTTSTREAVQQTISAAFFDPDAAAAVASGRLVRELEPSGAFADVMDSIVGGGVPSAPQRASVPADELAARRARKDAERSLHEAEHTRDRLAREQTKAAKAATTAKASVVDIEARAAELERELRRVRHDLERGHADAQKAESALDDATDRLTDAERAVTDAEAALRAVRSSRSSP